MYRHDTMANEQSRYLTTSQAARYCNYEDGSSLRRRKGLTAR